ncbi:hypothetical protein [Kitasatospora sp. NPDC050543]|uniref:hypothetical protein n=1 Tax=Kitasatospora sp. NPDC050543 TaxID=3364054 RepID=UPI00379C6716
MSRDETSGLRAAQLRLGRLPGYVRQPDLSRRNGERGHTYKKGWEVRFTARTEAEIAEIRDLVIAAGFAPARPFFKGHQLIQPVYGMAVVQTYLAARQVAEETAVRTSRARRTEGDAAPVAGPSAEPAAVGTAATAMAATTSASPEQQRHAATVPAARATAESAAGAAAAIAARAAATVELAGRRAVEGFPSQVERATATDRIGAAEAGHGA